MKVHGLKEYVVTNIAEVIEVIFYGNGKPHTMGIKWCILITTLSLIDSHTRTHSKSHYWGDDDERSQQSLTCCPQYRGGEQTQSWRQHCQSCFTGTYIHTAVVNV